MYKNIEIEDNYILMCPKCKSCYLHQTFVDVGFRKEDENGLVTEVTENKTITSYKESNNNAFSKRRDRVTIYFYCEECTEYDNNKENLTKLTIDQHKGNTFIRWLT
jgi:hypothetical protein